MADIPWTWLTIRGTGVTAWGLLTAVVLWGLLLRTRALGKRVTPVELLDLHRWLGVAAVGFLLVHMGLLLVDPMVRFTAAQLLVPGLSPWNVLPVAAGQVAFWLLLPVTLLGRLKGRLGKTGARLFRRAHLVAYAAWPLATAHYVLAGTDVRTQWSLGVVIAGATLVAAGLTARAMWPAGRRSPRSVSPTAVNHG